MPTWKRFVLDRVVNPVLSLGGVHLESAADGRQVREHLKSLDAQGHFARPVYPVPQAFRAARPEEVLRDVLNFQQRFASFREPDQNKVGYTFKNVFYSSPDTEVYYTLLRKLQPPCVIEVGCGNSTRIARQAVIDGQWSCRIVSIDPEPRIDLEGMPDEWIKRRVETLPPQELLARLVPGAILFIDSSHRFEMCGDLPYLLFDILPHVQPGVIVHFHDIFLPHEYPAEWISAGWDFDEQYLLLSYLLGNPPFEVLWAGRYHQTTLPEFAKYFPDMPPAARAQSLWLRRI
jgi:hypothetical protein